MIANLMDVIQRTSYMLDYSGALHTHICFSFHV